MNVHCANKRKGKTIYIFTCFLISFSSIQYSCHLQLVSIAVEREKSNTSDWKSFPADRAKSGYHAGQLRSTCPQMMKIIMTATLTIMTTGKWDSDKNSNNNKIKVSNDSGAHFRLIQWSKNIIVEVTMKVMMLMITSAMIMVILIIVIIKMIIMVMINIILEDYYWYSELQLQHQQQ